MSDDIAIAIDGPVASGKTAVGRLVARRLGYRFLDTGTMYRAVTWSAMRRGIDLDDEEALAGLARSLDTKLLSSDGVDRLLVDGKDVTGRLRDPDVDHGVSAVSAVSGVRAALVKRQRAIASEGPIVVAGRDIGTVVLPEATLKVYLTASAAVRARRRWTELERQGGGLDSAEVVVDLRRRDKMDLERADSPLRPAEDAVEIDTGDMGVEETAEKVLRLIGRG